MAPARPIPCTAQAHCGRSPFPGPTVPVDLGGAAPLDVWWRASTSKGSEPRPVPGFGSGAARRWPRASGTRPDFRARRGLPPASLGRVRAAPLRHAAGLRSSGPGAARSCAGGWLEGDIRTRGAFARLRPARSAPVPRIPSATGDCACSHTDAGECSRGANVVAATHRRVVVVRRTALAADLGTGGSKAK